MSVLSRIFGPKDTNKIKWFDDKGKPKTIIASGKASKGGGGGSGERNERTLKSYWGYYLGEGTIFASINTIAWNTVMVGYHLVSVDPDAKKLIEKKFDLMDLDGILLDNVIFGLVYGDAFIEKVRAKGKDPGIEGLKKAKKLKGHISSLKTVDPLTMVINTDEYGNEISYQQKIGGKLMDTELKPEEIIHVKFFPQPSSPYGISLIQPNQATIDRKMATDETIFNAVQRHTAKYLVKVGDAENIPPASVFTAIKSELEDINSKNEFIVPGVIDMTTIDERGVEGVSEYFDTFQKQMIVGLLCPEESLGLGTGSTEATAKVKEIMFERFIKAIQHKLAQKIRIEIINDILLTNGFEKDLVHLRFNSVTDSDEAVKSKWLGNLLRGFPEGKKPFSINEVRAIFDYPPIEGGDDIFDTSSEDKPKEKPKEKPEDVDEDVEEKPEE